MNAPRVLISGASIAGPTLAYWLNAYGFEITVVEQAPFPRDGGQAIDVRGTARQVVDRMGITAEVRAAHTGAKGMMLVDGAGRERFRMGADLLGDSGGFIADIEILRGDLVKILYNATRDDVEYIFDDSITALREVNDGVLVSFRKAAPRRFDLVMGADGVHSNVRQLAFGAESNFVHDLGACVAVFRMPAASNLDGWHRMCCMPGHDRARGRTAAMYPLPGREEAIGMLFFPLPPGDYDRRDVEQQKSLVTEAFAADGWEVPRLLDAMTGAPDFFFDRVCQVRMAGWSRGRVVLIGDAGYCGSPLGGNGSSMAMVGAYVLAGELTAAARDHAVAFARYEAQMRDFVTRCQKFALGGVDFHLPKSRFRLWAMSQMMRMLPYLPWRGVVVKGLQGTANALALQDYPVRPAPPAVDQGQLAAV